MSSIHIFGYGSLLNPDSRARTFNELSVHEDVELYGYQRKLNAVSEHFSDVAMNIVQNDSMRVRGVVVEVHQEEFPRLLEREIGYEQVEVTSQLSRSFEVPVFTFIAPDQHHQGRKAFQTYLDRCLGGVPEAEREQWLLETIIECEIYDDRENKQYEN